jgi:hypothetical protein
VVQRRTFQEKENRRLVIQGKFPEIPRIIRSRRSCARDSPYHRRGESKSIGLRSFGVRGLVRREFNTARNPESRFSESIWAVDPDRDTWRRIPLDRGSAFGVSQSQRLTLFEIAKCNFPIRPEPSIIAGQVARIQSFGVSAFGVL